MGNEERSQVSNLNTYSTKRDTEYKNKPQQEEGRK